MSNPPTTPNTADMLDPGLGNVLFDTWLVSRAVHSLIDDVIKPTGLDADEFAIYSILSRGDGVTSNYSSFAESSTRSLLDDRGMRQPHSSSTPSPPTNTQ